MAFNFLIVDDSPIVRAVIKQTLGLTGLEVGEIYEAENGKVGLDMLDQKWVDMVFADINMPVMTGVEMIQQMRKNNLIDKMPVVVVSTEGSKTRLMELEQAGVKDFLRKPFLPEQLSQVIKKHLVGG